MDSKNLNLYFREIIYQNPKIKKDSVCGVFSYEALNIEDAALGNLYLVGKISNIPKKKYRNYDFLLSLLASAIKREFYSNHQRNSLEALESALQSANIYLSDFAKKGHKDWVGNLDFACLVFCKNEIHAAQAGNMIFQLFRGGSMSNINRKFQNPKEPESSKTFSNIASGKIEKNDKIIIATEDILKIISNQKIKELIFRQTPETLYRFIQNALEQNEVDSLTCLILEAETQMPKKEAPAPETDQEAPTEATIELKPFFDSKAEKINKIVKDQIVFPSKITLLLIETHIIKYLLGLFLIFIIILSPLFIEKINYDLKIRRINGFIQRIEEDVNRSKLSLVYQNQSEAQAFLKKADDLLGSVDSLFKKLPESAQKDVLLAIDSVREKFEQQKNNLNNVINIEQLEKLADLSKNTYNFSPHGILKLENNLYLYELTSGFIYKIDLINNNSSLIFLSSKDTFKLGTANDTEIILLANPTRVSSYNIYENYNIYLLRPDLENTLNIRDMAVYNENIFFLNTEKLNILQYSPTGDVLNGAGWLKITDDQRNELINAQSLTIDGDIYVSRENGIINRYSQGKKIKEIKPEIVPLLLKGNQLFTSPQLKNLYILDPPNNRIILIDKKDGLTKQYVSHELNNLKDIWVDSEGKIYLLNGLEVYRVEI